VTTVSDILEQIKTYAPDANVQPVMDAYLLAARAHSGQTRKSGEAYLSHPLAVAMLLANMRMDVDTIATALLHDALEDNPITKAEMAQEIGPVITELVDGVTKIGKLKFRSKEELAAENFRKMMLAMSKDLRVILVKLADRTHNMSTLEFHKPEKRIAIAQETMDIYVPIANRLGLSRFKSELEDLCFQYLHPEPWAEITEFIERTQADRERYTARVQKVLSGKLEDWGIQGRISGRAKHHWSIYRKMCIQGLELSEVSDLIAFRMLLPTLGDCYAVLGQLHGEFPPVPDRIKDYIARPKANGYQSLHTTVIGPEDRRIEVQIRTEEMHHVAEMGIAAHWKYKEGHLALSPEDVLRIGKVRDLFESAQDAESASEFMASVKVELYSDEVFVFTPQGDIKRFPLGATVLDFAYAIHTDVGQRCTGGKVDGKMVPLRYEMLSGDHIEIVTSSSQRPHRGWLEIAKTGRAIQKIRRHLRALEQEQGARLGREMVETELKRFGWNLQKAKGEGLLKEAVKKRGAHDVDTLFVEVARGAQQLSKVVRDILPEGVWKSKQEEREAGTLQSLLSRLRPKSQSPVLISGEDDMLVNFANCCAPLPGESVVGYITRGRGITVHKRSCNQMQNRDPDRCIAVEWTGQGDARHSGEIEIVCTNRPGMLANISSLCEKHHVNIQKVDARSIGDDRAVCTLRLAIRDIDELTRLIKNLEKIRGVESVYRSQG
jgi:GTP pyrophosphokinase